MNANFHDNRSKGSGEFFFQMHARAMCDFCHLKNQHFFCRTRIFNGQKNILYEGGLHKAPARQFLEL